MLVFTYLVYTTATLAAWSQCCGYGEIFEFFGLTNISLFFRLVKWKEKEEMRVNKDQSLCLYRLIDLGF